MSQEESLYDLFHSKRVNALRNSEKFLAAVEYFKGREDIIQERMKDFQERGTEALLTEEDFQRIIEESKKVNIELPENFTQVYVADGLILNNETEIQEFEELLKEKFDVRAKYLEQLKTFPDIDSIGRQIEGTGNRNDVFFTIHDEDVLKFKLPKFKMGASYLEDILTYCEITSKCLYPKRIENYRSWKYKDIEENALPLGVIDELSPFPSIALEYAFGRADMENYLIFDEESRKEKT